MIFSVRALPSQINSTFLEFKILNTSTTTLFQCFFLQIVVLKNIPNFPNISNILEIWCLRDFFIYKIKLDDRFDGGLRILNSFKLLCCIFLQDLFRQKKLDKSTQRILKLPQYFNKQYCPTGTIPVFTKPTSNQLSKYFYRQQTDVAARTT